MTPSGADPRTPATIVSHPEYPHWGPGYVFRTRKTAADIFFQWGGKRTIPADDPLQAVRSGGSGTELFTLCAEISARGWSRGHHTVYAVELDRLVWKNRAFRERNPGGAESGCLYVGLTGLAPEERFERHREGTQSGRFVRTHGTRLRLDLVEGFSGLPYRIAACMEPKLAAWLRAQGFAVWQN